MLHAPRFEFPGQVGLVDERIVGVVAGAVGVVIAGHQQQAVGRRRGDRPAEGIRRVDALCDRRFRLPAVTCPAQDVAHAQALVELVLDLERRHLRLVVRVVVVREAVVGARRYRRKSVERAAREHGRLPVVRDAFFVEVVVGERDVGGLADVHPEARREAVLLDALWIAVVVGILAEGDQPECAGIAGAQIEVCCETLLLERPQGNIHLLARKQVGHLARLVDQAAAAAAAEHQRRGPFQHFDRFRCEQVAVVLTWIAHPVEIEILVYRKTAQVEHLICLDAAFRRRVADAGNIA